MTVKKKARCDEVCKVAKQLLKTEFSGVHPYEINCGRCDEFSDYLEQQFPDGIGIYIEDQFPEYQDVAHKVFLRNGKFYDAENPEGVDRITDLQLIKMMDKPEYHKQMHKTYCNRG